MFLKKTFFQIPDHFNINQVYDLWFKIHHIFNINFDKQLVNAMLFIQHFVYGMKGPKKPTTKMEDVFNRLIRMLDA